MDPISILLKINSNFILILWKAIYLWQQNKPVILSISLFNF